MPTAREVVAQIFDDSLGRTDFFNPDDFADQFLSILSEAGYAVVPSGVTDEMFKAAMDEADRQGFAIDDFSPPIYFTLIYQAMLSAHAKEEAQ